jgi:hypothetical protein
VGPREGRIGEVEVTEDAFRALARSSPWRWRTLHFTYADDHQALEAWLRRPGQLLVRRPGHRDFRVDDRKRDGGKSSATGFLITAARGTIRPALPARAPIRWPHQVQPVLRPDGLVAERPTELEVVYDDPMYQSYDWVALLDPVELSHHTTVTDLHEKDRLGRRTWWARIEVEEGYEPRCGCCPLLWSFISDRDENAYGDDLESWTPPPDTSYPDAYDVALDVETAVAVERSPIGVSGMPAWHRVQILEVNGDLDGLVPAGRPRLI